MPQIPDYQPDLQVSSPQGGLVADPQVANDRGQALQTFGRGVTALGDAIYEDGREKAARETTTRNILANSYRQKFVQIADTAEDNAYTSTDAAGTTLAPLFQKEYDQKTKELAKDITDPLLKTQVESFRQDGFNDKYGKLLAAKRKMFVDNANKEYEGQFNTSAGTVLQNPMAFDREYQTYTDTINGSLMTEPVKAKAVELAGQTFSKNAVLGWAEKGASAYSNGDIDLGKQYFQQAKASVTGPLSKYIPAKDQDGLLKEIAGRELTSANTQQKLEDQYTKARTKQLEIINDQFMRTRMDLIIQRLGDDSKDSIQQKVKDLNQVLQQDVVEGMPPYKYNFLHKVLIDASTGADRLDKNKNSVTSANIAFDITSAEKPADLKAIKQKIFDMTNADMLDGVDGRTLLNSADAEQHRMETRIRVNKSAKDPQIAEAKATIKAQFANDKGYMTPESARSAFNSLNYFEIQMKKPGMTPKKALNNTLDNQWGIELPNVSPGEAKKIQRIHTQEDLDKYNSDIAKQKRLKKIEGSDYKGRLLLIKKKQDSLDLDKEQK